jgi:ribosomal-protein-alanine acetyltransferase
MSDSALRIRRMSDADLECVLKIAESLREAPHWTSAAYVAAMDEENVPRRIALVAEWDSGMGLELCEGSEKQTAGAEAHARLAGVDAGTKVPAYQSPAYQSSANQSSAYQFPAHQFPACYPSKLRLVGFAVVVVVAGEAELESIAVVESGQRRGVGSRLLRALVRELRTQQVGSLNLEVRASNRRAIRFYSAQGFGETGRRERYYAVPEEDAVLMRLRLA